MYAAGIDFYPTGTPAAPQASADTLAPGNGGAWPFPIQCAPGEGAESILAEFCEIALTNDRKLAGTLVHFAPDARTLTVLASHSVSLEKVNFDELLSLRLTRPVTISHPQQRLAPDTAQNLTQSYTLTLLDGVPVAGETVGSVEDAVGLYIYHPLGDDTVERRFYPHSALRAHQVGERLGEILLKHSRSRAAIWIRRWPNNT